MPKDSSGKFHINPQIARLHDSLQQDKAKPTHVPQDSDEQGMDKEPAKSMEIHGQGDGSYHSVVHHADGTKENDFHPDFSSVQDKLKEAFCEDYGMDDEAKENGGDADGHPESLDHQKPGLIIAIGKKTGK